MFAFIYIATLVAVAALGYIGYLLHARKVNDLEHRIDTLEIYNDQLERSNEDLYGLTSMLERKVEVTDRLFTIVVEANSQLATTVAAMTTTHEMLITEIEERNKELAYVLLGSIEEQVNDQPIELVLTDVELTLFEDVGLPINPVTIRTWDERMSDLGVDDASIGRLLDEVKPDDN